MSNKNEFPISDSTFLLSAFAIFGACVSSFLTFILVDAHQYHAVVFISSEMLYQQTK